MKISEFCKNDLVDYASYSTIRAIASLIDGQKNASRKVLYTVLEKNITNEIKVSQLSSKMAEFTEYLHGSAEGVITNLAQNYVGTNNINLLYPEGNFGTRFAPEPSASRYIQTYGDKKLFNLFIKEDNEVLIKQYFEGTEIEPKFYVPTLPLILVNGSEGIATGFSQKILPRKVETIKEYIRCKLNNTELPELKPFYNGFEGVIEKGVNDNQWIIKGKIEKISVTKLLITELPIGYSLATYVKVLDELEDKKIIKSYKDLSENDKFKFEITAESSFIKKDEEEILNILKLIKKVTENFTVLDENNRIISFKHAHEIFDHYIKIKLLYLQKRKDNIINKLNKNIKVLQAKYDFINEINENTISVTKVKKENIIKQLEDKNYYKANGNYDYLLNMPIYNLTFEMMEGLTQDINKAKQKLSDMSNKTLQKIWEEEIND